MVKRYELSVTREGDGGEMMPRSNGGWVAYSDYETLAAELAEAKARSIPGVVFERVTLFGHDERGIGVPSGNYITVRAGSKNFAERILFELATTALRVEGGDNQEGGNG